MLTVDLLWSISFAFCTLNSINDVKADRRITGGRNAHVEKFPSFTLLKIRLAHKSSMFCGGTYIHKLWVLTASHCLDNLFGTDRSHPRVGDNDRINVSMGISYMFEIGQVRQSTKLTMHPKYLKYYGKPNYTYYDIGLIRINKEFNCNKKVNTVQMAHFVPRNSLVYAVGFGDLRTNIPSYTLQMIEVKISQIQRTALICIDVEGKNFCSGDSGGPMYLSSTGDLVGVISMTYKNCENGVGVYISVPKFRLWISDETGILRTRNLNGYRTSASYFLVYFSIFLVFFFYYK